MSRPTERTDFRAMTYSPLSYVPLPPPCPLLSLARLATFIDQPNLAEQTSRSVVNGSVQALKCKRFESDVARSTHRISFFKNHISFVTLELK